MPRSSYHRRHRQHSSSKSSDDDKDDYYRDRSKKKSESYYSRSTSRKKSESRSQSHKKRSRRSPSTSDSSSSTNSSSKSSRKSTTVEPTKPKESINLNLLDGQINSQTIIDIDDDNFQQKAFTSSKPLPQKVIIDLQKDIITVPSTVECPTVDDSIFHPSFLGDETKKMEKWIRKLYNYRQRLVNE